LTTSLTTNERPGVNESSIDKIFLNRHSRPRSLKYQFAADDTKWKISILKFFEIFYQPDKLGVICVFGKYYGIFGS